MMSLWDALRMNMMISYQELVRTFLNSAFNKHSPIHIARAVGWLMSILFYQTQG